MNSIHKHKTLFLSQDFHTKGKGCDVLLNMIILKETKTHLEQEGQETINQGCFYELKATESCTAMQDLAYLFSESTHWPQNKPAIVVCKHIDE